MSKRRPGQSVGPGRFFLTVPLREVSTVEMLLIGFGIVWAVVGVAIFRY